MPLGMLLLDMMCRTMGIGADDYDPSVGRTHSLGL